MKTAAFLAFVGTILAAALLTWDLVFDALNVMRGLIPAVRLFSSFIYAFAALTVGIFLFIFHQQQR